MTQRYPTSWKLKRGIEKNDEHGEIEVSQNDTITWSNFNSTQTMLNVTLFRKDTGVAIGTSTSLNVTTVTGSATNAECIYTVWGYKP